MTSKTIASPHMGLRAKGSQSVVGADKPCMGIGESGICAERATCKRYALLLAGSELQAMRTGRVGAHACHYRIEATK